MFVERVEMGDCMGCGINADGDSKKVYFTRNGSTVSANNVQCNTIQMTVRELSKDGWMTNGAQAYNTV